MATTASPKATDVPMTEAGSTPQFRLTAVPQPMRTSTIVPTISARYFFIEKRIYKRLNSLGIFDFYGVKVIRFFRLTKQNDRKKCFSASDAVAFIYFSYLCPRIWCKPDSEKEQNEKKTAYEWT
jgi:hypothetical protein